MDFKPESWVKIRQLLDKGIHIPNPMTIDIGQEVSIDRISGKGIQIYPGCRIYGEKTVISAGCRLGYEAPVTLENAYLGPKVELKGGFFSHAVFLEKANMGMGAHVREGTILEEEANGAHCIGLKQTILFPFVTLGSLINFCDCLMAGGTSRKNHSEVGSSYIHFNYTPNQDKATASLIGDVPRGVMLNQPPIFLGGQGGMVGPLRLGYGNTVTAGSILRQDCPEDNKLITNTASVSKTKDFIPAAYPHIGRILQNNILYLANLTALESWYTHVRKSYFAAQEFGALIYAGAMDQLSLAKTERLKRLKAMAETVISPSSQKRFPKQREQQQAFHEVVRCLDSLFAEGARGDDTEKAQEVFLTDFHKTVGGDRKNYIEAIQYLPPDVSSKGVAWLNGIVADWCKRTSETVPSMNLFKK
jgi:bifunctional UDP-N-acetylglucosamine pyrophosphorylase/glucosamine-1-phosphate N-acetyltransferase